MINKRLRDWKLRSKIILHVLVIGTITAAFISFFYTKSQKDIIKSTGRQTIELVSSVIENSIHETMMEGDAKKAQSILKNIGRSQNIERLRILNSEGKILYSTHPEEIETLADETTRKRITDALSTGGTFRKLTVKPKAFIQEFRAIGNRQECFTCHDPKIDPIGVLEVEIDYSAGLSIWQQNRLLGIIVSLSALAVLTFIILRLFEKLINRPLSRLKNRMKKIEEGDLTSQVPVAKEDEIGSLAKSFNIMVAKLDKANRRIEELFERQMEKAEHLASLGEIAAGLAHEIKNPVAGIQGALEIIYKRSDDRDINKDVFKEMLVQIKRIHHIIQDLLSYAKPKELHIRPVVVEECILNAIKMAKTQVKNKDIRFHFIDEEGKLQAQLDADKIQEVLLNFMLNSIAAIDRTGTITVHLKAENGQKLKIMVTDDGEGIRKDQLSQIFQPFFTTKSGGTGLGLSICQKTIEAHSGTIDVESDEGKGTIFSILLPLPESSE